MSPSKKSKLADQSVRTNKAMREISGDQNIVERVENGGVAIQGSDNRIEIIINRHASEESNPVIVEEIKPQYFEPVTILIPAGTFLMGSPAGEGIPEYETPQHEVDLPSYRIGKYPVKNAEYEEFISQKKLLVSPVMRWDGQRAPKGRGDYPVTGVTWYEALVYCEWLSEKTSRSYSLPNEAQWEKACRGGMDALYPWGNEFDPDRCNYGDNSRAQNEYKCFYLVGIVRQWTSTLWGEKRIAPDPEFAYPWKDNRRNNLNANRQIRRVVRGSAMKDPIHLHRCSARSGQPPEDRGLPGARYGFRVAMAVK